MTNILEDLVKIIKSRKQSDTSISYTSKILSGGLDKCIDKMDEEFLELKEALKKKENIIHESADLLYHFLISLESAGVNFKDVLDELENRKKQSGINEKKNR